jgi:hypothetical protein
MLETVTRSLLGVAVLLWAALALAAGHAAL